MNELCSLANRIILSINPEEATEDQELLINQFRLSYSHDEDNSDVENILVCEEDFGSPRSVLLSPKQETDTVSFTLTSFLHYVSTALSTLALPHERIRNEDASTQLKSELSIYLDRICSILDNGPQVHQWLPNHVFACCPDCHVVFTSLNRRQ